VLVRIEQINDLTEEASAKDLHDRYVDHALEIEA